MVRCSSSSPDETRAIARAFASILRPGDVVLLSGDLGAGKTCFVQGAAEAFGVEEPVTSPTFVIVRTYRGSVRVVHADVYRLTSMGELIDLGFEDLFDPGAVTFVEWGDAVAEELPPDRFEVAMSGVDARTVDVRALGSAAARSPEAALARWAIA
ncbi:MAG TPA: tRNA (adenosine(37)-N6)-threonylcarbamoyltransferase complex ATPase subunit type 1 TsaE [Actinomycetota bacterium]